MQARLISQITPAAPIIFRATETRIPAGFPSPAQDYAASTIDLNDLLFRDPAATYIFRVTGSSMIDAGIADGDEIIVDRSLTPQQGSVVVAAIDGDYTIKRFHIDSSGNGWLMPENVDYPPIPIPSESDFTIFGVVTRSLHYV